MKNVERAHQREQRHGDVHRATLAPDDAARDDDEREPEGDDERVDERKQGAGRE